ncbi:secretin and TonB N-terminal domain-containing protein [Methylobacillus arboreus]|uniref:secretin N-terminal domain-containing protein n=1 Tax=Methylobacillus arboreus TaxID=755170 RepID=UPI001E5A3577|nr:secretin N-terminal domain-containing protein [Methylobacillus arboreus]MCB5190624.1 secretin and TonB N-terminal domain-containing protein [Methylobacillus arboreus]
MLLNSAWRPFGCCLTLLALSSCALTPWPKPGFPGDTSEEKIENTRIALDKKPEGTAEKQNVRVATEQGVNRLLVEAEAALRDRRMADAGELFQRVLAIEPDNPRAQSGKLLIESTRKHAENVERANQLLEKGDTEAARELLHQVLLESPQHEEALRLQREIRQKRAHVRMEPPKLKPAFDKPVSLELRDANIKMVFEALSRATGINFILDKDIKPDTKATVFIKKSPIEEAIEMVLATNGLQKKVLSENTALVFPNTAAKLKDYQDLVIRNFYLTNAKAKDVSTMIKTMLKTKDVHTDERLNMIVVRDTPEVVRIAEKLVAANDLADPEVMLEIEVMEVTRERLQELGIEYPTSLTASAGLSIEAMRSNNSGTYLFDANPSLNFRKTTGDVNILANPRIRVRNNDKAQVLVGDKVPVITTVATAGVGSSQTVQYLDVGLKLEAEPRITLDDFVNIKIALEVSSLGSSTTLQGGGVVYQIGTRNASTLLRLKDGETQILAGLINDEERKNTSRLPGLGDIPLLGRLFSNQIDNRKKTEIVLAITPRVVNNISRPESEVMEYWSGTETGISDHPQIIAPGTGAAGNVSPREMIMQRLRPSQAEPPPAPEPEPEPAAAEESQPAQDNFMSTQPKPVVPLVTPEVVVPQSNQQQSR